MKQQIYANIADDIIEKIQNGYYKSDEKLPSERILSENYDASISSIKKALKKLIDSNYIYSVERMGYYVMSPKFDEYIFHYHDELIKPSLITQEYTKPAQYIQNVDFADLKSAVPLHALLFEKYSFSSKTLINYEHKYIFSQKNTLMSIVKNNDTEIILNNIEKYSANNEIIIETEMIGAAAALEFDIKPDTPFFKIIKKSYDKYGKIVSYVANYYRFEDFNIKCFSKYIN